MAAGLLVTAAVLRSFLPGYHPDKVSDPAWIGTWQQAYAGIPEDGIPLLDTVRSSESGGSEANFFGYLIS